MKREIPVKDQQEQQSPEIFNHVLSPSAEGRRISQPIKYLYLSFPRKRESITYRRCESASGGRGNLKSPSLYLSPTRGERTDLEDFFRLRQAKSLISIPMQIGIQPPTPTIFHESSSVHMSRHLPQKQTGRGSDSPCRFEIPCL